MRLLASLSAAALVAAVTTSASAQSIPYAGGPVLHHARVRLVLLGSDWATDPVAAQHTVDVVRDVANRRQFYDVISGYGDQAARVGAGAFDESYVVDTRALSRQTGGSCDLTYCVNDGDIVAALADDVGHWPDRSADDVYVFMLPAGTALYAQDPHSARGGKHGEADLPGLRVPYVYIAMEPSLAHELAEAITDPFPTTQPAWTDRYGTEIGDPCNADMGVLDNVPMRTVVAAGQSACSPWPSWPILPYESGAMVNASQDVVGGLAQPGPANAYFVAVPRADVTFSLGLFAITPSHEVHYQNYDRPHGWMDWIRPRDPGWVSRVAATSTAARGTDLFGIGGDGRIYWKHADQPTPNAPQYEQWTLVSAFTVNEIAVAPDAAGAATVFAIDAAGVVHWQLLPAAWTAPDPNAWGTFDAIPGGDHPLLSVVAANGSLYVAASGNRGWPIYLAREDVFFHPGGTGAMQQWEPWQTVAAPPAAASAIDQILTARSPQGSPGGERLVLLAVSGQHVWRAFDDPTAPSALASRWQGMAFHQPVAQITAANNDLVGRLEVFALGVPVGQERGGRVEHIWQGWSLADSDWAGPASLGGEGYAVASAVWPDGRLELYVADRSQLVHDWQFLYPDGKSIGWAY